MRWNVGAIVVAATWASGAWGQERVHFTYLWHLEQPIYWPDRQAAGAHRYERAWESIQRTDGGAAHPANNLRQIFGLDDRVAAYQYRPRDSVNAMRSRPEAGVQVTYSGGLIENIQSLGGANQLGYSGGSFNANREARGWTTVGGKPRMDIVLFSFHHALLPLCDDSAVRKEVQLYKSIYGDAWGTTVPMSRGFFPSEMAFSERLIPILASEGIVWSFVSAEKISRACVDFPVVYGSGGINCDPPNRADQTNPAATNYYRVSISRGCAPAEAYPYALTPRRAQYIDPSTGASSSIIVVPCSQSLGWKDGYAPLGMSDLDALQSRNDPSRPMLVVLAHDGDNAWGGGYSYYMEATPQLVNSASGAGYVATTVEQYLQNHPVPVNDMAKVEDGAWVNADGDFGAPQFINWNWPLLNAQGQIDPANGWHVDARNWAVITAAQNRVDTAEQVWTSPVAQGGNGGTINIRKILYPDATTNNAERAWHYFLGSLNSGYMYYGNADDMEVKPTIACNEAVALADAVIGGAGADRTAPTVWVPQRHPWNPGSVNFGPQFGYQQVQDTGDFWVWTFAYDVSGLSSVTLKYRVDADGVNSTGTAHNETYAGGSDVGAWQSVAMARRPFPAGNVYNDGSINFFEMPQYIAEHCSARITGVRNALVDYYIEATDARGYTKKSAIQHVYVGPGTTAPPAGATVVISPALPTAGQAVVVVYNPAGRALAGAGAVNIHWGVNTWTQVTDTAMTLGSGANAGKWVATLTLPAGNTTQLDCVFNNGAGIWDNNSGQDWHFAVTPSGPPPATWTMDGIRDTDSTLIAQNNGMSLWAGLKGDVLYVACPDAGEGNDHFIFVAGEGGAGALRAAPWAKAGQVASWGCFVADENNNDYEGWFDHGTARVQATTSANGGVLEGTVNLRDMFGTLPEAVYLAVGPFATNDGGALAFAYQVPVSTDSNATLNSNEYRRVELCDLDSGLCCVADVDDGTGSGVHDGGVTIDDLLYYLAIFEAGDLGSDVDDGTSSGVPDGGVTIDDLLYFLQRFESGC